MKAKLPDTKPGGESWDPDGLPDPYAIFEFDGGPIGASPAAPNTVSPDWSYELAPTYLMRDDTAHITVYDEDGDADELMMSCMQPFSMFSDGNPWLPPYFLYRCVPTSSTDAGVEPYSVEFSLSLEP